MNLGYLTIGLIFLFNPNINIVDIFPDFIGFLLICRALEKSSDIIERLGDARKLFRNLSIVTMIKTGCIFLIPFSRDEFTLVLTFVSSVIELMYLIPAVLALFDGLVYAGSRFDGTAVFKKVESIKYFTIMFIILKSVCVVLPELTALSIFDSLGNVTARSLDIKNFKPAFIIICTFVTLVFGIIWLVRIIQYTKGITKDTKFIENLETKYNNEILPKTEMFICRNMKTISTFVIVGVIASISMYVDSVNIIPNIAGAAFFIVAFTRMMKSDKIKSWAGIILSGAYGIIYAVTLWIQINFSDEYGMEAIKWINEADRMYQSIEILTIIGQIFLVAAFTVFIKMYRELIISHVPRLYPAEGNEHKKSINNNIIKSLNFKLGIFEIIVLIACGITALKPIITLYFGEFWLISAAVDIIRVIITVYAINEINENIYNKYLYYN